MKKRIKLVIFIAILLFTIAALINFYSFRVRFERTSLEMTYSKQIAIISTNIFFLVLMFLINSKIYKKIFKFFIIFSIALWIYVHSLQFYDHEPLPMWFWNFWDTIIFMAFSFLAPALIFYIIYYIHKTTERFEESKIRGYHIHEGFAGIILLLSAFFLWILLTFVTQIEIMLKELSFVPAIIRILLFLFIFCGSFLIFRDWDDVKQLKFLEKKEKRENPDNVNYVFLNLTENDIHFFKAPKIPYFPFGMLLTSFTIDIIVFGTGFLPIDPSVLIIIGYVCCFISGAFLGRDWFRIFKIFYPQLHSQISVLLDNLKSQSK